MAIGINLTEVIAWDALFNNLFIYPVAKNSAIDFELIAAANDLKLLKSNPNIVLGSISCGG